MLQGVVGFVVDAAESIHETFQDGRANVQSVIWALAIAPIVLQRLDLDSF